MKSVKTYLLLAFALSLFTLSYSQGYHVRIAFIGNSITAGDGLTNPNVECYPARVKQLLETVYGDTCIVYNSGLSGRTMLKHGDVPIWSEIPFKNCWNFAPDIVLICLGTNDTKPQNWDDYGDEFFTDYKAMVDTFKLRNPLVQIIVCYPPPAFQVEWGIRDSIIVNGVMPVVDDIKDYLSATLIDFHSTFLDSSALFPDHIHPNAQGALAMANMIFDTIIAENMIHKVDTGYTYVTSVASNAKYLARKDTATISWTTINADTVYLDGLEVDLNGSIQVTPFATKTYTVIAAGIKSRDTLSYTQVVYAPQLTKLYIYPGSVTMDQWDSVKLYTIFKDQYNFDMKDTLIETDWSIYAGDGLLIDDMDTSIVFIATTAVKTRVQAAIDDLSTLSVITINPLVGNEEFSTENSNVLAYPIPCTSELKISFQSIEPGTTKVKVYDVKGSLHIEKSIQVDATGAYCIDINTSKLKNGVYIYKIECPEKIYNGSFTKIAD